MRIHVLTTHAALDPGRLPGKVVVVLDVLFATTSIAAALASGASDVLPAVDGDSARAAAAGMAAGSFVLAGERGAVTLPGFDHPTPLALLGLPLRGRTLVYSTTNGTVALHRAAPAPHVYAAALANGEAVARRIASAHREETVLVVCAGSEHAFNLEDFLGAGHLVSHLLRAAPEARLSDAALAARLLADGTDAYACLAASRVGRMMRERRLLAEVEWAARKDHLGVVPVLRGGRVVPA
ncbi:MAG TPA: 2-phosphosulfolactate phosphatase [Anaeromyxobacteraceae bacterium]|jgi:2-phosphosulfolactate phosphatase|nr:2-phosphosulfolactate phosphatase [Anaeromyxobacteraceae bacterium]